MDVRCDRCETEYELDDAIVTDAGASVQCTTCGHTFVVTRRPSSPLGQVGFTPPTGLGEAAGPEVPEWTLSTDDGKVHRFRDLNTLQKWIVERKVTPNERISRAGGPWLALGEVVELAPFFRVVDEADRARATGGSQASSGRAGSSPSRSTPGITFPPPTVADARGPVSEDGPTVPNRRLPGMAEHAGTAARPSPPRSSAVRGLDPQMAPPGLPGVPSPGIRAPGARAPGVAPSDTRGAAGLASGPVAGRSGTHSAPLGARTDLALAHHITAEAHTLESDLRPSRRGRNLVLGLCAVALAGGGGYWWLTEQQKHARPHDLTATGSPPSTVVVPGATPGPSSRPAGSGTAVVVAMTAAGSNAAGNGSAGGAGAKPSASRIASAGSSSSGPSSTAIATGPGGNSGSLMARGRGAPTPGAPPREDLPNARTGSSASSYDRLVAEADRLLERGKSAKADKLYAQALAARPDGVAALTGAAYVLLDRQRHFRAIETFRRALSIQPTFGPALFGIAESYRARGDSAQALGAYRQYLAIAPSGTDAPAARRQIKDLEAAGTSERSAQESPAPTEQDP